MIHDDLGNHLPLAGSFERAAIPLGMYLAWCANLQLLSDELALSSLVLRVKYREITGAQLAVAGCGGELRDEHLNAEGRDFTAGYFGGFYHEFAECFGVAPADVYRVRDDWEHYDQLAQRLTRRLMATRSSSDPAAGGHGGHWWHRLFGRTRSARAHFVRARSDDQ